MTQLPFVATLVISFMNWNAYYPDERGFAGLDNFVHVFTDTNARSAVLVTIILTVSVVLVSLVLGLVIALLLDRKFRGRGIVRTHDDHPVPHRPGGRSAAVEARSLQPGVRPAQRRADLGVRRRRAAAGLDQQQPADRRSSPPWSGSGRRS